MKGDASDQSTPDSRETSRHERGSRLVKEGGELLLLYREPVDWAINGSKYCYVILIVQFNISNLFAHG